MIDACPCCMIWQRTMVLMVHIEMPTWIGPEFLMVLVHIEMPAWIYRSPLLSSDKTRLLVDLASVWGTAIQVEMPRFLNRERCKWTRARIRPHLAVHFCIMIRALKLPLFFYLPKEITIGLKTFQDNKIYGSSISWTFAY